MENEWFRHDQLTLDPSTETYWASQAIHDIADFDAPGGATNYGNAGSSGDSMRPEPEYVHLGGGYAQFPPEPPLATQDMQGPTQVWGTSETSAATSVSQTGDYNLATSGSSKRQ